MKYKRKENVIIEVKAFTYEVKYPDGRTEIWMASDLEEQFVPVCEEPASEVKSEVKEMPEDAWIIEYLENGKWRRSGNKGAHGVFLSQNEADREASKQMYQMGNGWAYRSRKIS